MAADELARKQHNRALRSELFGFQQAITDKREDFLDLRNDALSQKIQELNILNERVNKAPDQAIESELFRSLAEMSKTKLDRFCASHGGVEPVDFMRELVAKYAKAPERGERMPATAFNWARFADAHASALFRTTNCARVDFMMGSLAPLKVRKPVVRSQRAKEPVVAAKRPDALEAREMEGTNETSRLTEEMFSRVKSNPKLPWAFAVLCHDSFAQTIENMFSVSMLVSNSKVALRKHAEWGMCIEVLSSEKATSTGRVAREPNYSQMIINMNFAIWERMRQRVPRESCLTPFRAAEGEGAPRAAARGVARRPAEAPLPEASAPKRARR